MDTFGVTDSALLESSILFCRMICQVSLGFGVQRGLEDGVESGGESYDCDDDWSDDEGFLAERPGLFRSRLGVFHPFLPPFFAVQMDRES
ncbi:unnamed protein product [Periconia digitata]|uniref:Uncharacterized protein n=1 Tax=Periconia digitata TaxID=1303443 RepID=A0A9W4XT47_9PLEO|nr:unnamed protein product [Periconia digitata]